MKIDKIILTIFIFLTISIKAQTDEQVINELKEGKKIIFIRHAFAPGNGDPTNFNINNCLTQRNLSTEGKNQAKMIKKFFLKNHIIFDKKISSEWCRCKETAEIIFSQNYETKSFLNSFYDTRFIKNKDSQIKELKRYVKEWNGNNNLVFITHYVVISEILGFQASSGEIVISDKDYNVISNLKFNFK